MTNEELLERFAQGDESALAELCEGNTGLIRARAREIAGQYNCLRRSSSGGLTDYTKETLSDLESVGMVALIECVRNGGYDQRRGAFTTYLVPFLDGAMRRHLEASMGTLSLDRESMTRVRRAQALYHREGREITEVAEQLGISSRDAARAVTYPTHSFSVSDLAGPEDGGGIPERFPRGQSPSPEDIACREDPGELLEEKFLSLPKRDQDILGRFYGVFGYAKAPLREIAIRHRMKESGVEKAKDRALKKLRKH